MAADRSLLDDLLVVLPDLRGAHAPGTAFYTLLKGAARTEVEARFRGTQETPVAFGSFGEIRLPYHSMGNIDSLDLFGLDELILLSFYGANRGRYRKVLDVGANLGLHSIIMDRCGFAVTAVEPDPVHFGLLERNLRLNACTKVTPVRAAVSSTSGTREFTRVLGNTTGSHLSGSKPNPYGKLETFPVEVRSLRSFLETGVDLMKIDAEGHEKEILGATRRSDWEGCDAIAEIGSAENARAVFEHLHREGVSMFAQKLNWERVGGVDQMPTSHRDGSLFITTKGRMPWG